MIWPLAGLAVATLCVYPKELRRCLRKVPIAIAAASLLLGALPLVGYNLARHGDTLSTNAKLAFSAIPHKIQELKLTLDGSGLLGPLVASAPGPLEQTPKTLVERVSVAAPRSPTNWMLPAVALSLACMVFLWRAPAGRLLVFILIATAVTWLEMAANAGTGGAAHHIILLWPFPCVFVGVALAALADRAPRLIAYTLTGLVALIVCGNLLNTNEYLANLTRNGAAGGWTDAFYRLTGAVYPYRSGQIGIVDWGYINGLRMMYEGDLKLTVVSDFARKPAMTSDDRRQVLTMIGSPDFVFVQHTDDNQLFPGVNEQLSTAALSLGYAEQVQRVVHDDQGRPVFEIFHFVKPE